MLSHCFSHTSALLLSHLRALTLHASPHQTHHAHTNVLGDYIKTSLLSLCVHLNAAENNHPQTTCLSTPAHTAQKPFLRVHALSMSNFFKNIRKIQVRAYTPGALLDFIMWNKRMCSFHSLGLHFSINVFPQFPRIPPCFLILFCLFWFITHPPLHPSTHGFHTVPAFGFYIFWMYFSKTIFVVTSP